MNAVTLVLSTLWFTSALAVQVSYDYFDFVPAKCLCYTCQSKNYDNIICEKISRYHEHIINYIGKAENCLRMVLYKTNDKNITTERILRRCGFPDSEYEQLYEDIDMYKRKGYKVDFYTCKDNRCNNL